MTDLFDLPPRVALDFTTLDGETVTITRSDIYGNTAPVRSANPAPLSAGEWIGYDYECPFGVEVWYTATTDTGHTETDGPLALVVEQSWLIHPGIPLLSQRVTIADWGRDRTSSTNQGVHHVLERTNPVVITDGVRHGSTFDLVLKTETWDDADALRTLLADASVLLLQISVAFSEQREYLWIAIGDVVESRVSRDYGNPKRRWTLPCTVTDPPAGTLQATWTYADLAAGFATYQDVFDSFETYRDLVTDTPSS